MYPSDMDGIEKGIVPSELFETYRLYQFEDLKLMGIQNADKYLKFVFGNYIQLPPEKQRLAHYIEYINLDLPYRDHKRKKFNSQ